MEIKMILFVRAVALAGLLGLPIMARAQSTTMFTNSGNYFLPGCKSLTLRSSFSDDQLENFKAGQCLGAIMVLQSHLIGYGAACMPSSIPLRQVVRVVVKYMEDHPAQLHEDFLQLAGPAIHDAWPCQTPPNQPHRQ